jgi:sulfur-oxidizing protein SoxX
MHVKSTLFFSLVVCLTPFSPSMAADAGSTQEEGRNIAFDKTKGNCLACHAIPNDPKVTAPGDIGPALIGMKSRYPDRAKLRAQIWDATVANPKTAMPPFGKNKILTETEIDLVTDYIFGM